MAVAAVLVTLMLTVWKKPEEEPPIEIAGNTVEAVNNYQDRLKEIYETSGNDMEKVQEAVDATLATDEGKKNADAVKAAQAMMQYQTGNAEDAVEVAEEVNPGRLDLATQKRYYNKLGLAYAQLGDSEKANEYYFKSYKVAMELGGYGGF